MRNLIRIVEGRVPLFEASTMLKLTRPFVQRVREIADHIAADIAEDFAQDDAGFRRQIETVIARINQAEPIGAVMTLVRAELRPHDVDPAGITSVGCHWSFTQNGAQVYHHDNARDDHGDNLVNVLFVAEASFHAIDWPYTIATNLILPAEEEITVKNSAEVALLEVYVNEPKSYRYYDAKRSVVGVSGSYDSY